MATRILPSFLCLFLLCACGSVESPETEVRRTVDAMERAAEARDVGDLMAFVSDDFRDQYGQDRDQLHRVLHGYFIANQSVHLLVRVDEVVVPAPDEARVRMTVGMVGREADAANAWNLAADVQDFGVTFRKTGNDWRVIYAERDRSN